MFAAATLGIMVCMGLALGRALLGPTVYDRILAVNSFGTKTVLMIAVMGGTFMAQRWACFAPGQPGISRPGCAAPLV